MKRNQQQGWELGSLTLALLLAAPALGVENGSTNAPLSTADLALRDPFTTPFAPTKPVTPMSVIPTAMPRVIPTVPMAQVAPPPDHSGELRAALQVQGFLKQGDRQLAMVGGRLVGVGGVLQARVGEKVYRFRVLSIQGTAVKFEPLP